MDYSDRSGAGPIADRFALMDATEQANLVQSGEATSLELVEAAIGRIAVLNPKVNAIACSNFDLARQQAKSVTGKEPFSGVPTLIKDLLPYPGHTAGFGSRLLDGAPALTSSDYADTLQASGLIALGKSTVSEFGLLGTTETLAKGATRNPWDITLSPGGSSGGAVAAVAAGMVPIAHASDGGGSIRGPSSFCGLFGFKPGRNRTVSNGVPAEMPTAALLAEHCVSRSVRDSARWLQMTENRDLSTRLPSLEHLRSSFPKNVRIGFYHNDSLGLSPTPEVEAALHETALLCETIGCDVFEIKAPCFDPETTVDAFFDLMGLMLSGVFAQIRNMMGNAYDEDGLEPYTLEIARRASDLAPADIEMAQTVLAKNATNAERSMQQCDVVLSPTVPFEAFPLGRYGPETDVKVLQAFTARLAGYTFVSSLTGWPAMTVPLHWTDKGLPVGSHFTAPSGKDPLLFSLAYQLEQARPWKHRLDELTKDLLCHNA
ncbi:amidase [Roseibium album]|uniref:amidase n=1 Tax=Roseibium album TaxID=311410 RepID=UPI003BAF9FD1